MLRNRRQPTKSPARPLDVSGHWDKSVPHGRAEARSCTVERSRARLTVVAAGLIVAFSAVAWRLGELSFFPPVEALRAETAPDAQARRDVLDRHGELIARDVATLDISLDPSKLDSPEATADAIGFILPQIDPKELKRRFAASKRFAYVMRDARPKDAEKLHQLGLPGVTYARVVQRAYPKGRLYGHVLGYVNIDNEGLAGLERALDAGTADLSGEAGPVKLSLDTDVQYAVREELAQGLDDYGALSAVAIVLDVNTGEVWSMVSLPDFDPNQPGQADASARRSRAASAVYEMGSVFKPFTFALGLDRGDFHLGDRFDARRPLKIGGRTIDDYHAQRRVLSAVEVFVHSSNIGTAQIALAAGPQPQQDFLRKLGLLEAAPIELPESARPIVQTRWTPIEAVTISYGHGIAVTPIQLAAAGAALVNGGHYIAPTLLKRRPGEVPAKRRVLSEATSEQIRALMRANVVDGTGSSADVRGYDVGGKTGTAEKLVGGRYSNDKRLSSFLSVFPAHEPEFVVFVLLDEPTRVPGLPKQVPTGGATAAPLSGRIISRIAPMMGLVPEPPPNDLQDISFMRSH